MTHVSPTAKYVVREDIGEVVRGIKKFGARNVMRDNKVFIREIESYNFEPI